MHTKQSRAPMLASTAWRLLSRGFQVHAVYLWCPCLPSTVLWAACNLFQFQVLFRALCSLFLSNKYLIQSSKPTVASVVLLVTTQWHIYFYVSSIHNNGVLRKDCSEMLGDLRQMCKQFIQQRQFIPLSLISVCVSIALWCTFWPIFHTQTRSHPCAVSVLVFHICRSCVAVVAYVSMLAHELQCVQRNGQVKSHYIVERKLTVTLTYSHPGRSMHEMTSQCNSHTVVARPDFKHRLSTLP